MPVEGQGAATVRPGDWRNMQVRVGWAVDGYDEGMRGEDGVQVCEMRFGKELRMREEYDRAKGVKWFRAIGDPPPTREELAAVAERRADRARRAARRFRESQRALQGTPHTARIRTPVRPLTGACQSGADTAQVCRGPPRTQVRRYKASPGLWVCTMRRGEVGPRGGGVRSLCEPYTHTHTRLHASVNIHPRSLARPHTQRAHARTLTREIDSAPVQPGPTPGLSSGLTPGLTPGLTRSCWRTRLCRD